MMDKSGGPDYNNGSVLSFDILSSNKLSLVSGSKTEKSWTTQINGAQTASVKDFKF